MICHSKSFKIISYKLNTIFSPDSLTTGPSILSAYNFHGTVLDYLFRSNGLGIDVVDGIHKGVY